MASSLRPTANQYHVGWLCAIEIEYSVVIALLEPRYQAPLIPPDDPNHYTCGKIQGHNVVICCLAKDRHGIASAAATAQNMQRSFTNLRVRLMVGIGGGAPTATQDIRLGDVVVSSPARKGPAVIHYEFGKTIQNQDFHPIGFLSPPPTSLLNLLATVDAHHRLLGNGMRRTIRKMAKSYPLVADQIQRPHDSPDILYHSDFAHPNTFDSCKELDCLSTGTCVDRPARKDVKPRPHVHYGLIASADRLMKDAVMRDRLADRHGVLCFEMEAAGSMDTFPCLIIRGISDYSDSHKHDVWHGYAAAAAAAYASELLRKIPGVDKLPDFGMSTISLDSDLNEEYNKKHTRDSARPYQEAVDTTYSGTDGFGSRARMMGAPASPSGTKQAIFVLSIDDGDLPLSSLYMLKEAMYYLGDSKPCEYFDMIGGFGTGALIAIMLGRLRMTVDACINAILPLLSDFMAIRRLRHEDMRDPAESAIAQTNFERSMQQLLRDAPFEEGTAYKQRTLLKCHTCVVVGTNDESDAVALTDHPADQYTLNPSHNELAIWQVASAASTMPEDSRRPAGALNIFRLRKSLRNPIDIVFKQASMLRTASKSCGDSTGIVLSIGDTFRELPLNISSTSRGSSYVSNNNIPADKISRDFEHTIARISSRPAYIRLPPYLLDGWVNYRFSWDPRQHEGPLAELKLRKTHMMRIIQMFCYDDDPVLRVLGSLEDIAGRYPRGNYEPQARTTSPIRPLERPDNMRHSLLASLTNLVRGRQGLVRLWSMSTRVLPTTVSSQLAQQVIHRLS